MIDGVQEIAGILAAIVSIAAYIPYIVEYVGGSTKTNPLTRWMWKYLGLRGGTKPHQASWLIWAALQYVIFMSMYESGAFVPALIVLGYLLGSSTNAIIMFWYGEKKWGWLDISCGALAVASLIFLYIAHDPFVALLLAIITDAIGAIPTLVGVTKNPTDESRVGWSIFMLGALINLFAIKEWNFQEASFTIYLVLVMGYIIVHVWRPRRAIS